MRGMKLVISYLLAWIVILAILLFVNLIGLFPAWLAQYALVYQCAIISGTGGVIYCFRGIYTNYCGIGKEWDGTWDTWYYLRPVVSLLMGPVAYIFLNAAGKILDMEKIPGSSPYGFLVVAFIAGYNVDGFLQKVERIALSQMGVKPTRVAVNKGTGKEK